MGALAYLLGAIVVSAVATMILVARHRKPQSMDAGMREFRRGLDALDPANDPHQRATGGRAIPSTPVPARRLPTADGTGPQDAHQTGGPGPG